MRNMVVVHCSVHWAERQNTEQEGPTCPGGREGECLVHSAVTKFPSPQLLRLFMGGSFLRGPAPASFSSSLTY